MTSGQTSTQASWRIELKKREHVLTIAGGEQEHQQRLGKKDHREIQRYPEQFAKLMAVFAPAVVRGEVDTSVALFGKVGDLTDAHFASLDQTSDAWTKLAMLKAYGKHPRASAAEALRLAAILKTVPEAQGPLDSHYVPSKVSVQKISLTHWLDCLDYLLNGDLKEPFSSFEKKHAGRVFPIPKAVTKDRYYSSVLYRPDDLKLKLQTLERTMHRFIQLGRRSRKLERKLHSMPLDKLINALDFEVPGTLLVTDTVELMDSLKHVPVRTATNSGYYSRPDFEALLGRQLANKLAKEGLSDRLAPFLGFGRDALLITDVGYGPSQVPFFVHALRKLGPKPTVEMLETIRDETDGVTMRGFMELVRRGGFTGPEPAAWTAVLLANK